MFEGWIVEEVFGVGIDFFDWRRPLSVTGFARDTSPHEWGEVKRTAVCAFLYSAGSKG